MSDGTDAHDGDQLARLTAALEVIGPRWALLVVNCLLDGPKRYGDLQRELGAPTNVLATRLKELQAAGILYRLPLAHNQRAYALTDHGVALRAAITALSQWGGRGEEPVDAQPVQAAAGAEAHGP